MAQTESCRHTLPREELLSIHRKEKKELQAKIQGLKHSIPKGDKKKKKDTALIIAKMEQELSEKHEKELLGSEASLPDMVDSLKISNVQEEEIQGTAGNRISKAQKRRDKKANLEKEKVERIAQQELENLDGNRQIEINKFKDILESRQLEIFEIPSDGNCMYKAISHQLELGGEPSTVTDLRKAAVTYMQEHESELLPFMTDPKTGNPMTSAEFSTYCNSVASTSEWGGQIELQALCNQLKTSIEVLQAQGPSIILGENYSKGPLLLSYHRHMFGLGEHYNSVIPKKEEPPTEEEL